MTHCDTADIPPPRILFQCKRVYGAAGRDLAPVRWLRARHVRIPAAQRPDTQTREAFAIYLEAPALEPDQHIQIRGSDTSATLGCDALEFDDGNAPAHIDFNAVQ